MKETKMPKAYEAMEVEDKIYEKWESSGVFNPDNLDIPEDAEPFTIVLPPPNITDKLHLGHASMVAIEDIFIRHARMKGKRALWIPGTDHAAIATQNVVEKHLFNNEGKTRHDLGREKFLERVWEFLYQTQSVIQKQIRKMGPSIDWSRECFTLDKKRAFAVRTMFCKMFEEGVIYKGHRIVNWCPRCGSTLSDDELEYQENKDKFYYMKYGPITIGTVRPETKFLDKTIVVHPEDDRYKDIIGSTFMVPWINGEVEATVIADESIDMNFGTGAMTITPAHSFVDFEIAERHNLDINPIIDEQGNLTENAGEFAGKNARESREAIIAKLEAKGLIEKVDEDYENKLSVCYRCDSAIEPLVSEQWFVNVNKKLERLGNKSLKEKAIEVVDKGETNFVPERFEKTYRHWMENLHDWCISRQIWFGHRIPVWYCSDCGSMSCSAEESIENCTHCKSKNIIQDEDTLDTWFSSGTWTFSTLGWPEKTKDLDTFHPTMILETGYEIITLWVSRMIMMSLYALEETPFKHVYLHGMVLDDKGKKMSKSKGNGIDPLDMITKYGTDALRLSILTGNTPGTNMRLGENKIETSKHFVNKLWNISRYILSSIDIDNHEIDVANLTLADKWILQKNNEMIVKTSKWLDDLQVSNPADVLRDYTWNDVADWYVEIAKIEKNKDAILLHVLKTLLKLWHPYIPFVTEQIWSYLEESQDLIITDWPMPDKRFDFSEGEIKKFTRMQEVVTSIRNVRSEKKVATSKKVNFFMTCTSNDLLVLIQDNKLLIEKLTKSNLVISYYFVKPGDRGGLILSSREVLRDSQTVVQKGFVECSAFRLHERTGNEDVLLKDITFTSYNDDSFLGKMYITDNHSNIIGEGEFEDSKCTILFSDLTIISGKILDIRIWVAETFGNINIVIEQPKDVNVVSSQDQDIEILTSETVGAVAPDVFPIGSRFNVVKILEGAEIRFPITEHSVKKEKEKLHTEIVKHEQLLNAVSKRLENEEFVNNAPAEIVTKEKEKQAAYASIVESLRKNLEELN